MTDSQCVDYLENICKMFVNGSKNCEGKALEYQQRYISAIRYAIAKIQSQETKDSLDYKVINRGKCMLCGKELTEGLFFCEECEKKGNNLEDNKNG